AEIDRFAQAFDPEDGRAVAHHRGFGGVLARQDDPGVTTGAREQRAGQRALDALDATVERELAQNQVVAHALDAERAGARGQDAERNREVERRALLAGVSRREVDSNLAVRKVVARVFDRRLDPLLGLAHRALGQPHRLERWHAAGDVDLDFDREGIYAGKSAGQNAGWHARLRASAA